MNETPKLAVLVSSCDAYSDAWQPFFDLFFKFWPECPYRIYLVSETKKYSDSRIIQIHNPEKNWSKVIKSALQKIPENYILYLQEDYFLKNSVDTKSIYELVNILQKENAACLRVYPAPSPNQNFKEYKNIGSIKPGTNYRLSLQAALWNKNILSELIREGESPWQAEYEGSKRTNGVHNPFLGVYEKKYFDYVCTAIVKGKWTYDAIYFCRDHNIKLDTTPRGIEEYSQYIRRNRISRPGISGIFFTGAYILKKKIKAFFAVFS